MAGGVGERIFLYQMLRCIARTSASQVSFRACSSSCSAYRLRGDDVPSGRRWPCCHTPLSGVPFKFSTTPDCHIPVPAPGVPRAQCGAVSARRSGHHRLHERRAPVSASFRRPAPAHFFPALPVQWPYGLIHQAGVLKMGGSGLFQLCQCGLQIFRDGVVRHFPAPRHFRLRKL